MANSKKDQPNKEFSHEFMIKEIERLHELRLDATRQLEERVSYFLTVSSAGVGGVVIISQIPGITIESFSVISIYILAILLIFGILTLNRTISRNQRLSKLLFLMRKAQTYFGQNDKEINEYLKLEEQTFSSKRKKSIITYLQRYIVSGNLEELIIVSNSIICTAIVTMVLLNRRYPINSILFVDIITLLVSLVIFYLYFYAITKLHSHVS